MPFAVADLACDPEEARAGEPFKLTVTLQQKASADVMVTLEKQRIVLSNGGQPELRPTGPDYLDLDPKPIKVKAGAKRGTSDPIQVRKNAKAEQGERPVVFPEQTLFTAFGKDEPPAQGLDSVACWCW
jgi:hypothetical protein